jgi:O-antigen/teichoic acid export membrane protein
VILKWLQAWWHDALLRGVLKNSSYLFSSNSVAAGLSFLQGIFATRLLGVDGYGLVSGTIIVFVSNIHTLLSFRMSESVVRYTVGPLKDGQKDQAAAVVKVAGLLEAGTSVLAYGILLLLAPLAGIILGKDTSTTSLFTFYGSVLLVNMVFETCTGVLRAARRFDRIAQVNLGQSIITFTLITWAYLSKGSEKEVLGAYLAGKTFAGLFLLIFAARQAGREYGRDWWRASLKLVPNLRGLLGFAFNTNLNGTLNLLTRDSLPLYLTSLRSLEETGYFRLAQGLINLVMLPIEPIIWPTYTEITNTIIYRQWETTKRLLRRISTIAGVWTLTAGSGLVLFGWWLIPLLYTPAAAPTYPAMIILLIGYGFANTFQWNRPLLLALGKPGFPVRIAALVGLVELLMILWLVPDYGYLAMAAILSGYLVVTIGINVWKGLSDLRSASRLDTLVSTEEGSI